MVNSQRGLLGRSDLPAREAVTLAMTENDGYGKFGEERVSAFVQTPEAITHVMTATERADAVQAGAEFAEHVDGTWLLISGRFTAATDDAGGTHEQVRTQLRAAFDGPDRDERTIKVIVDSSGGNLDSAYATVLYLSAYAKTLEVYVPDSAKSASTLLAVGADKVYLSAFGELGPLDSQIRDPRNPVVWVSALDCYQSVDYVRDFGIKTVKEVLDRLVLATDKRISVNDLVSTASTFSLGIIDPMMRSVSALDFGGWGRSLMISEHYARKLLEARNEDGGPALSSQNSRKAAKIAHDLVYGYPHHLFPIDIYEARRIGLRVEMMDNDLYEKAIKVVNACRKKDFVGFISKAESARVEDYIRTHPEEFRFSGADTAGHENHRAEANHRRGYGSDDLSWPVSSARAMERSVSGSPTRPISRCCFS